MTALADILPFTVTSGKYKFRFLPEPEGGFSVSCVNVKGINAQGDTFEDALRDAISAAAGKQRGIIPFLFENIRYSLKF